MKILTINNLHKMVGGAERYYFDLNTLLQKKGHQVASFSMLDKDNVKSKWSKYFVSNVDHRRGGFIEIFRKIPRIFYSVEAKLKIKKLLNDFKPDIVHLNNIYYCISPSILSEITKRNIPIVQTVHDFELISPNVILYHDGKVCEAFKGRNFWKVLKHRCVDNSYIGTFLMLVINFVQNFNDHYNKSIDAFISPSVFMKNKLVEYKFDKNKLFHINNFLLKNNYKKINKKDEKYILYFGRLNEAKGIYKIVKLAKLLPQIKIKLAGKFDVKNVETDVLQKINDNNIQNIEFLGFKNQTELQKIIRNSRCVIAPSQWHENQSYSILEALSLGIPIVATKMGGNPEIVQDGVNGLLFDRNDINDFAKKVLLFWNNEKLANKMGESARKYIEQNHGPEDYYKKLILLYKSLLRK